MDLWQEHIKILSAQLAVLKRMYEPSRKYAGGRNCQKGYNCGGSCIARAKNCRKALPGEAKNYIDYLATKMGVDTKPVPKVEPNPKPKAEPKPKPEPKDPLKNIDPGDYNSMIDAGKAITGEIPFQAEAKALADRDDELNKKALDLYKKVNENDVKFARALKKSGILEEMAALEKESAALETKMVSYINEVNKRIQAQQEAKGYKNTQAVMDAAKAEYNINDEKAEEFTKKAAVAVYRLSGGKGSSIEQFAQDRDRAYATMADHKVNIGKPVRFSSVAHEMAHHMEAENPKLLQSAKDWVQSKATGPEKTLAEITGDPRYSDKETAIPDDFTSPYVGRVYKDNTEVYSVGIQALTNPKDMIRLAGKDPEHLQLVIGMLLS